MKRTTRKVSSMLLALCLITGLFVSIPVSVGAVVNVAQIGGTPYATLTQALAAAADGDTIDILSDFTESVTGADKTVTIIGHGHTITACTGSSTFTDVNDSDWYSGYVKTALEYKIISGYGDGKFGPLDKITRE